MEHRNYPKPKHLSLQLPNKNSYFLDARHEKKKLRHVVITLLELCQLTKTANFIATPMKKHIQQFITCLLEMQARFLFFSRQIKMSNLLHVGLILIISKVLTILCLLCLCRNREYPGNFQNKTLINKLFFQECPSKVRGKVFLKWTTSVALLL